MPPHLDKMAAIYHPKMAYGGYAPGGMVWQNSTPVSEQINGGASANLPAYNGNFGKDFSASGSGTPSSPSPQTFSHGSDMTAAGGGIGLGGQGMVNELGNNAYGAAPATADSLSLPELGSSAGVGAASGAPSLGIAALALKSGGKVPGKAPKKDAYKNDTVDAKLTPGEVVIDINTLKDKGKLGQMARFVAQNIERKKMGRAM